MHIRTHDRQYDWEVVPPGPGQNEAQAFGDGATVAQFQAVMHNMTKYFGLGRLRFFVASNDPEAKRYMHGKFEGCIALFGDDGRSSRDGMQFALMEFLLLSKTALILHTFGSTFAMEVSLCYAETTFGYRINFYL